MIFLGKLEAAICDLELGRKKEFHDWRSQFVTSISKDKKD